MQKTFLNCIIIGLARNSQVLWMVEMCVTNKAHNLMNLYN